MYNVLKSTLAGIFSPSNCRMTSKSRALSTSLSSSSAVGVSGTTMTSTADLASFFECPVCFEYVLPPILQCPSGHLVCSNCRPKLSCCPTCRGPLGKYLFFYVCYLMSKLRHSIAQVTFETWPWRKWRAPSFSRASMPHLAAKLPCFTQIRGTTKKFVSTDPTPVPVQEPLASGKGPLNKSCHIYLTNTGPLQPYKVCIVDS